MKARTRRNRFQFLPLGIQVLAGAVGVLAGIHFFMSSRKRDKQPTTVAMPEPVALQPIAKASIELLIERLDYFAIRRTRSELGYVFWVLQGFGEFQCYLLCDSWQEAMDEASVRMQKSGKGVTPAEALAVSA